MLQHLYVFPVVRGLKLNTVAIYIIVASSRWVTITMSVHWVVTTTMRLRQGRSGTKMGPKKLLRFLERQQEGGLLNSELALSATFAKASR